MNGHNTPRQFPLLAVVSALAFAFLPASPIRAANIVWDTPTLISSDTDVSTTGSLLYAYNFGSTAGSAAGADGRSGSGIIEPSAVPPATVNGVTFASFPVASVSAVATVGNVTLTSDSGDFFYTTNTVAGSGSGSFASLSSSYQGLLQSGVSTFIFPSLPMTLTLGGLTNGQDYLVEFWSNDSGSFTQMTGGTSYTAGNTATLDNNSSDTVGDVGQWVTGNFMATGTTQVITIQSSTPNADFPVITAFQLRAVPEPSSVFLLLSGVLLCLALHMVRKVINAA